MAWTTRSVPPALEPDDFEESARMIWADREQARRVGLDVEVDDNQRMIDGAKDRSVVHAVLPSRPVDVDAVSVIRKPGSRKAGRRLSGGCGRRRRGRASRRPAAGG